MGKSILLVVALALTGCTTIGPDSIPRDRFDYSTAIRNSWKHELLQNIVNLRYGGIPVFVDVASVISQYELQGTVSANATANASILGDDIYGIGGNARYSERPTITYQPLTGPKFSKNLLTPIPPGTLLFLAQSGYPIDFLLRIAARSVNGVKNYSNTAMIQQKADPEFIAVLKAMRRIQISGLIGIQVEKKGGKGEHGATIMVFGEPHDEKVLVDVQFVRQTLGLDVEAEKFKLMYGPISTGPDVLAIQSRSMLEIMLEMASEVHVPPEHVAEGRTFDLNPEEGEEMGFLKIHSQQEYPEHAYAAVQFEDHWFWIDNRDMRSKRMLTLLVVLSSLAESDSPAQLPVVTVGAG